MTPAQLQTLKTALLASTGDLQTAVAARNDTEVARLLNLPSTKVVWRNDVTRFQVYHSSSAADFAPGGTPTTFNWTTFKQQDAREQTAWREMFMGDQADFSLPNLRAGVDAIFSGAGGPATQRAHIAAIAKRFATAGEAIFATGAGTVAEPAVMAFTGSITIDDVGAALNLP